MNSVVIPSEVQAILGTLTEVTELRDTAGNLVGIFTPGKYLTSPGFRTVHDLQEVERIAATQHTGRTLPEIFRDLQSQEVGE